MDYLSAGHLISRKIYDSDHNFKEKIIDGQGLYGLFGMALWRDNILCVANVGLDFDEHFGDWFKRNSFSKEGLNVKRDLGYIIIETHGDDDSVTFAPQYPLTVDYKGLMRNTPEEIEKFTDGIRGMYIFQNADMVIWDKLLTLKKHFDFNIMWEIDPADCTHDNRVKIKNTVNHVDFFSITLEQSKNIFGQFSESEIVDIYKRMETPVLLHCERRGIYVTMGGESVYCPNLDTEIVDSTGSGTAAAAAAMVALCEGADITMIGAIAVVTAAINSQSRGVPTDVSPKLNERASKMVNQYVEDMAKK